MVIHDVSDLRRAAQTQSRLAAIVESSDDAIVSKTPDGVVVSWNHGAERRTPVNAIVGWAELLAGGSLSPGESSKAMEVIARNARLQTHLIEELLDGSAITAGKVRLEVRPLELAGAVHAAVESIRPSVSIKDLHLDVKIDAGGTLVMGDPARLQQVVWNLLNNALKFTPAGGRIQVELAQHASFARLTVTDGGVGIAADVLPHVFDRFRQAEGGSARRHGGLGLGLAIVRHLVELHGGSVWAESGGIGSGARFTVELSLLRGPVHGVPALAPRRLALSVDDVDLSGVRVLAVDDDHDARGLLGRVLALAGAEVREAASGAEALDELQKEAFDVIVADVGMPDMHGCQMLATARGIVTPAIALTAFVTDEDRRRAHHAGFQATSPSR